MRFYFVLGVIFFNNASALAQTGIQSYTSITTGAQQTALYLPSLKYKKVAIVTNASGIIGTTHLVDTLLKHKVKIVKIFGPEHGFRGMADAGEKVKSGRDALTNIPVISLYGTHKKPSKEDLKGVDVVVYDIQDVGVRFYTYISTMTYVMEACAENRKPMIILDRPNPNGFYIDGPVMTETYKSFLGIHPIPIVYGMTSGEYASMVNGEGWLKNRVKCQLTVIPLKNYDRAKFVSGLPVSPSPNLTNDTAIALYPTLGLFEGTMMSMGRGTPYPFQYIGNPYANPSVFPFSFTPKPTVISKKPKYQDTLCYGTNAGNMFHAILQQKQLALELICLFYDQSTNTPKPFFDKNFNYHSGNDELQQQIVAHQPPEDIRASWRQNMDRFKEIRKKYLMYKDF